MPTLQETLTEQVVSAQPDIYGPFEIVTNLTVAIVLGLFVALLYRHTHKGLSYSQSFTLTIVFVGVIVAIVMMVIGNSMTRAFALVGALSIIRFRTVVKDFMMSLKVRNMKSLNVSSCFLLPNSSMLFST